MKKVMKLVLASAICLSTVTAAQASVKNVFGAVIGVPVGFILGGHRGAVAKGSEYVDSFSDAFGDGPLANVVGTPVGLFVGGITGGITGLVNGAATGLMVGYDDPFTNESFSVDGAFIDYDPYNFDHL